MEAERRFGVSVNTWGVNDLVAVVDAIGDAEVDALAADYDGSYDVADVLRPNGPRRESLRDAARIELGMRQFLQDGGFGAFTTNFEDLGGLRQLPGIAVQRLMADGYGFGGEGDWKTSTILATVKAMGEGRPGGTSFMEDYTYHLVPGEEKILGAHMLEVCPTITTATPSCEIHPLGIGDRADPVRLVFTADPGPAVIVGHRGRRRSFPAGRQPRGGRAAGRAVAETACGARRLAAPARLLDRGLGVADRRGTAPHRPVHSGRHRGDHRSRRHAGHRAAGHRRGHPAARPFATRSAGTRPITGWRSGCSDRDPRARHARSELQEVQVGSVRVTTVLDRSTTHGNQSSWTSARDGSSHEARYDNEHRREGGLVTARPSGLGAWPCPVILPPGPHSHSPTRSASGGPRAPEGGRRPVVGTVCGWPGPAPRISTKSSPDGPGCRRVPPGARGTRPRLRRLHWSIPDPVRVGTDEAFDAAYDEITHRIRTITDPPT